MEENLRVNHNIIVEDRKKLTLTGVKDVVSFDDDSITLDTSLGRFEVKGTGLRIISFDNKSGDLIAEGRFIAFIYTHEETGGSFISKLFR